MNKRSYMLKEKKLRNNVDISIILYCSSMGRKYRLFMFHEGRGEGRDLLYALMDVYKDKGCVEKQKNCVEWRFLIISNAYNVIK